jgi:hypothetical protein
MCPIVSFSNEKSTTDQKKSPLRFMPSSDFIIENNCNIGHYFTADMDVWVMVFNATYNNMWIFHLKKIQSDTFSQDNIMAYITTGNKLAIISPPGL